MASAVIRTNRRKRKSRCRKEVSGGKIGRPCLRPHLMDEFVDLCSDPYRLRPAQVPVCTDEKPLCTESPAQLRQPCPENPEDPRTARARQTNHYPLYRIFSRYHHIFPYISFAPRDTFPCSSAAAEAPPYRCSRCTQGVSEQKAALPVSTTLNVVRIIHMSRSSDMFFI